MTNSQGEFKTAEITLTAPNGKSSTIELQVNKDGELAVKYIDSTRTVVRIPDAVKDGNENSLEIKTIPSKVLDGDETVKTLIVGANIETFEKNSMKGSAVTTIELNRVPKFEKDSLKTDGKLTIIVHSKKAKNDVEKQLEKAGAPNATVKVEKKK